MSSIAVVASAAGGVEQLREHLVAPLIERGHTVAVTLTPTAGRWLDAAGEAAALAGLTGLPVRWHSRMPDEPRPHPQPELVIAAPWTANSTAKLALGIGDNQALTLVSEALGTVPTIVFPAVNAAHVRHPAWSGHRAALEAAAAHVVQGPRVWPLREPRRGSAPLPWAHILTLADELTRGDAAHTRG